MWKANIIETSGCDLRVQGHLYTDEATMTEECTELVPADSRLAVKSTYRPGTRRQSIFQPLI